MFRIVVPVAALLLWGWTSSLVLAHPGHSHGKPSGAPAKRGELQIEVEDEVDMELLVMNELPFLLAQVDQAKARPYRQKCGNRRILASLLKRVCQSQA